MRLLDLSFDKEREVQFARYMHKQDILFLRITSLILAISNMGFLVRDYYLFESFGMVLLSRGIILIGLLMFFSLSFNKLMTSKYIQQVMFTLFMFVISSLFLFDHLVELPSYTLVNMSIMAILTSCLMMGIRFSYSLRINALLMAAFWINTYFSTNTTYYRLQFPSLILVMGMALLSAWIMERDRRSLFLNQLQLQESHLQLQEKNKKIEEANMLRNVLISIMSHDMISPLDAMKSLFMLEEVKTMSPEERKEYRKDLEQSLDKSSEMAKSLVRWSKSQLNGFQVNPEVRYLNVLVEKSIQPLMHLADQKDLEVIKQIESTHRLFADPEMVILVVRNLFSNAIKFSPRGGKILLSSFIQDRDLVLRVEDNGKGMDETQLSRIFGVGFSSEGTSHEQGSGIGLFLAKEFVDRNKGRIWVESQVGLGSSFFVAFPTTA